MPWKYIPENDLVAIAQRDAVLDNIAALWASFPDQLPYIEAALRQENEWDLPTWMEKHLHPIDPRLGFEFGVDPAGGYYGVITPESHRQLRPMVRSLIAAAPQIPGWSFHGYRPPEPADVAAERVKARTGHPMGAPTIQPRIGAGQRIDLLYQSRLAMSDPQAARLTALAATEALLGEEVTERWIGEIDVTPPSIELRTEHFLLPPRLRPTVQALAMTVRDQLPARPYLELMNRDTKWETFRLEPPSQADYGQQDDMAIGNTMLPEFRRALGSGKPFFSANFSRTGELFCYLKIDAPHLPLDERRRLRKEMEAAIERPLRKAGVAGIIGSGTGTRYVYFDLAVVHLDRTLELLRDRLRLAGHLSERSWLLFFDAELADEFIGLRPGAPPPPQSVQPKTASAAAPIGRNVAPESTPLFPPADLPPPPAEMEGLGFLP